MSSTVLIIVVAILVSAGVISIAAAAMGNPIRLGTARIPGPEGPVERAAAIVVGLVALACIAPVLLIALTQPDPETDPLAGPLRNPFPAPQPSLTTTAAAPASTTLPPRTASAAPGQKAATAVTVSLAAATGCSRTVSATVQVAGGRTTVSYAIYVNGVARTPAPAPVSGSGLLHLASTTVNLASAGTIEYRILAPNALSDTKSWTSVSGCSAA